MSPWVTGGAAAEVLVLAATEIERLAVTDRQLLIAVPTDSPGVTVADPLPLIGVSASATGPVHLDGVELSDDWLIAGPMPNVMSSGVGAGTGGIETSTLAVGLARAAIEFLEGESDRRIELRQPAAALRAEHQTLRDDLLAVARGGQKRSGVLNHSVVNTESESKSNVDTESSARLPTPLALRQRANSLASRASQAALSAAKGSGYVVGHPAGRWCREALFFLVWSCPQPVAAANLCELAGIES
jgi:alkylation response protein AidB-like acyl-CoA dehydrogenase